MREVPNPRSSQPELSTERLLLRAFRDSDLDAFAAINADPEVMRFIGKGVPQDRVETWRSMALLQGHWSLRGYGIWAVEEKESGEFIGRIGLYNPEGWPGLEVGWLLARSRWGQGLATEGARAALRFAWQELGASRVISLIRPENAASIAVARKLGEDYRESIELLGGKVAVFGVDRPPDGEQAKFGG